MMDLKAKGVRMIGIAWKDNPADTAAFLTRNGDPFALVLQDPGGLAAVNFGIGAAPETFLVDSSGKIVNMAPGRTWVELDPDTTFKNPADTSLLLALPAKN